MKKLFFHLSMAARSLPVFAQVEARQVPRESIVVSRYSDEAIEIPETAGSAIPSYKKWWLGIDAGFSYRVAKAAEGVNKGYINRMRGGLFYGADLHGVISRGIGLGVRYTGHRYAQNRHRVVTNYFAPSFQLRSPNRNDTGAFVVGCSIGYLLYREKLGWASVSLSGLGTSVDLGYDFRLAGDMHLGFKLTLTTGNVNTGLRDSRGKKVAESLSALDIGLGMRF